MCLCFFFFGKQRTQGVNEQHCGAGPDSNDAKPSMANKQELRLSFCVLVFLLPEELRSEITEDACMCEAQIAFQEKVRSALRELNRKHILSALESGRYRR